MFRFVCNPLVIVYATVWQMFTKKNSLFFKGRIYPIKRHIFCNIFPPVQMLNVFVDFSEFIGFIKRFNWNNFNGCFMIWVDSPSPCRMYPSVQAHTQTKAQPEGSGCKCFIENVSFIVCWPGSARTVYRPLPACPALPLGLFSPAENIPQIRSVRKLKWNMHWYVMQSLVKVPFLQPFPISLCLGTSGVVGVQQTLVSSQWLNPNLVSLPSAFLFIWGPSKVNQLFSFCASLSSFMELYFLFCFCRSVGFTAASYTK